MCVGHQVGLHHTHAVIDVIAAVLGVLEQHAIAPAFFPYNRCDVFTCGQCDRVLLKYTEYGGYYVDDRVRVVQADLVADAQPQG